MAHLFVPAPTQAVRLVRGLSVPLSAVTSQLTAPPPLRKMSFQMTFFLRFLQLARPLLCYVPKDR
jgi:hypothetical protein